RVPPDMLTAKLGGLVTAVTELADKKLVMMLDVEKVLSETTTQDDQHLFKGIEPLEGSQHTVYFADDSSVARKQIERTLDVLGVPFVGSLNGRMAWDELQKAAHHAQVTGRRVNELVSLVLTDVEMPEMDGYMLTRAIKSDPRFAGIPVIMHSSLSGMSNQQLGQSVGVDEYVPKFEPQRLAATLRRLLDRQVSPAEAS
ncbi:response regulator, partial [Aromatoleum sp.]|uniref:response regulator n=1 Tax=Aromatoleum sp. TaxID=2307007 RepID=UPI002FC8EC5F